jgi:hypothetical protein
MKQRGSGVVHDSRSDRPDTLLDEGRAARLGGLVDGEKRTFRRRKLIGSDSTRAKYSPPCPGYHFCLT